MGNCLWMAFLINKQILVVSYQWCLKHIVLIYTGASSHVPSLMFLTAWCPFWPHQCPHHIQYSLHLLEKYARYSGLAFQCWKRWAYSLFCSPLWKTSSFSPPQREKGPGLGAGRWAACDLQSLSGMHGEPEREHPVALGPERRARRETEVDQKRWQEYWKGCICLQFYFGCQVHHKINLKSSTNAGNWFFILRDTYLLLTISGSSQR